MRISKREIFFRGGYCLLTLIILSLIRQIKNGTVMEQAGKFYGKIKKAFSLTFAKSNEKSLFLYLICAFSQIILQFAYFGGIIVMYHQ